MNALEIKENRKRLGLTQDALGKLLGVSKRTIINYENGDVVPVTKSELLHQILLADTLEMNSVKKEDSDPYITSLTDMLFGSEYFVGKLKNVVKEEKRDYTPEEYREIIVKMIREAEQSKQK